MQVRHLVLSSFARDAPFHAAQLTADRLPDSPDIQHDHDFYEMVFVQQGGVRHWQKDRVDRLSSGELLLIRPRDLHTMIARTGEETQFTNIAFAERTWRAFCATAEVDPDAPWGAPGPLAPSYHAAPEQAAKLATCFDSALSAFLGRATALQLCSFWSGVLSTVLPDCDRVALPDNAPIWLKTALQRLHRPEELAAGVPRLLELTGVSAPHLSRTFRQSLGVTPTEYFNECRLRRAASLLITSPAQVTTIALECGFDNVSYFHRQFLKRYGMTPRAYRMTHCSAVVPTG